MSSLEKRFPIYSKLLKLYPAPYQKAYQQETLQTLCDMLDDPDNSRLSVWTRTVRDLPLSLVKQNLIYTGGIMKHETPSYVKRNSVLSFLLLAPFFIIVFSKFLQNNHISNSVAFQSSLWITFIAMPMAALCLCAYTFGRWTRERRATYAKSLKDIRRNWMLLAVGALAFLITVFVPFHDSTHCVTGNPVNEIGNVGQTWQCIWRG